MHLLNSQRLVVSRFVGANLVVSVPYFLYVLPRAPQFSVLWLSPSTFNHWKVIGSHAVSAAYAQARCNGSAPARTIMEVENSCHVFEQNSTNSYINSLP